MQFQNRRTVKTKERVVNCIRKKKSLPKDGDNWPLNNEKKNKNTILNAHNLNGNPRDS